MTKRNVDITNELSAISRAVDDLPKNTPFLVPTDYFQTFPEKIRLRIQEEYTNQESELELLSPLLHSIKKENPYSVPKGYFQDFEVNHPKTEAFHIFSMRQIVRYAAAACVMGLLVSVFFFSDWTGKQQFNVESKEISQSDFSIDAVETYLSYDEDLDIESNKDDLLETESNALVDLDSETIGQMLSELSENGIAQYMTLNDINDQKNLLN
jgi:hypothetical protein